MGIRIVVIDDNPHVSWEGRVYPVNATFHRFLAAVLDLPGAPVASLVHCVPLRPASSPPATLPLDERIEVLGTTPFDGIAGFLRAVPRITRRNARLLRPVIAGTDLCWIKVPASNGLLAALLAARAGVPRFGYVAGSARDVARARGLGFWPRLVGLGYDRAGRIAGGRHRIVVGRDIVDGGGIVTSLVEPDEIRDPAGRPWPAIPWRLRIAWAGRVAPGKGLEVLLDALRLLVGQEAEGNRVELVMLGDGPARIDLEATAVRLGIADRIHWLGYVADRATYMDALASCDLFVFPSSAEGFPKVVLDAMAVGLPVVATSAGQLEPLGANGLLEPASAVDAAALAAAVSGVAGSSKLARRIAANGHAFASDHTRPAETARLVAMWRTWWPSLPWG